VIAKPNHDFVVVVAILAPRVRLAASRSHGAIRLRGRWPGLINRT
jgi:hypothetical protein